MRGAYLAVAFLHAAAMASPLAARDCASDCDNAQNQCISGGSNRSTCDSDLASCKAKCSPTSTALTPSPTGDCKTQCQQADNQCRTKSGANLSTCESDLQACEAKCPGGSSTISSGSAASSSVKPSPSPALPRNCENQCQKVGDECRGKPGANLSTCSSDLAKCKESCPKPLASTTTAAPAPTKFSQPDCEQKCETADNQCRTKPGVNTSTCASDLAQCKAECGKSSGSSSVAPASQATVAPTKGGAASSTAPKPTTSSTHQPTSGVASFKPAMAMVGAGLVAIAVL